MLTRDDVLDAFMAALGGGPGPAPARSGAAPARRHPSAAPKPGPKGRPFLSERDIRKLLTPGAASLTLPKDAIISPLALDGLILRGIEIRRG